MLSNFLVSQGSFVAKTSPTGSGILPTGSTAQRDGSPSSGYIRFNSDDTAFEGYNGSAWSAIGGGAVSGIAGVSTFTSSGTWTKATRESALGVTIKRVIVEVVGGGAGGGSGSSTLVYAGPTGGMAVKVIEVSSISDAAITVGSGGSATSSGGMSQWLDTGYGGSSDVRGNGGVRSNNTTNTSAGTASGGDINLPGVRPISFDFAGMAGPPGHKGAYGAGGYAPYTINTSGTGGSGGGGIVIVWEIAG